MATGTQECCRANCSGKSSRELRIDGLRKHFNERHAELLGQGGAELVDRHESATDEDLPQHALLGALGRQRRLQLARRDIALLYQDVAEPWHGGGYRCWEVRGGRANLRPAGRFAKLSHFRGNRDQPMDF